MPLLGAAWQQGLAQGIPDDSQRMNKHILQAVRQGIEAQRQTPPIPAARPVPPPPQLPAADRDEAAGLEAEAAEHLAGMRPASLPPIARRSLPVAAPVSRDIPLVTGQRTSQQNTITLSPTEREIAWNSFGPIKDASGSLVDMTRAEKELRYAQNKALMLQRRKAGLLNE